MNQNEAIKTVSDRLWRLSHLYKIRTKDQKLITFKPNRAQADYLLNETNIDEILKARQLGITTLKGIEGLDYTITTPNTVSAIVAHEKSKVEKLFEIVRLAYDELPPLLKPKAQYDNRNELSFPELKSKIFVSLDTRGETVHNLHVSEVAYIEHAEEKMLGIMEAVPKGGRISWESTANGTSGIFYDTWNDPKSEFKKHFYNWTWDDQYFLPADAPLEQMLAEYQGMAARFGLMADLYERFELTPEQLAWYMSKVRRHKQLVMQEYPTTALEAFIASGRNVFHIQDLQKHPVKDPIDRKWQDCLIWEHPLQGFKYVMGVDSSEGVGQDNAVIEVVNAHTGEQAAEYASNHIEPGDLGELAITIARHYNNAFIVPEINNHGIAVVGKLKGRYANVYQRQQYDEHSREKHDALGWKTTGTTKPLLVDDLESAVRELDIQIHSEDAIKECKTFVRTDEQGKQGFGAEGSNKDDRVIALGLARQGMKDIPAMRMPKSEAQKRLEDWVKAKQIANDTGQPVMNRFQRNYKIRK